MAKKEAQEKKKSVAEKKPAKKAVEKKSAKPKAAGKKPAVAVKEGAKKILGAFAKKEAHAAVEDIWAEEKAKQTHTALREIGEKARAEKAMPARPVVFRQSGGLEGEEIILYPLITEKAVGMIESQNKLSFVVNKKASKSDVKNAIEKSYGVKVDSVNALRDMKGRKKMIVKINPKFKADDIAMKLGVI
jgi:large subunit ribosomal protein L23